VDYANGELLAGDGNTYRAELLRLGLEIEPGKLARDALHEYISTASPSERYLCIEGVGWNDSTFVFPDISYSPPDGKGEQIVFQSINSHNHTFKTAGSLADWQDNIAQYCVGNSRLVFAISCAFVTPLPHLANLESGGFHLRGNSSIGKSTALLLAGSVWGGRGVNGYCRTWRATSNGLEAVGLSHCDALLCLDEMGQVDGYAAGEIAYMLVNGQGKSRSRKDGSSRAPAQWRLLFLSLQASYL